MSDYHDNAFEQWSKMTLYEQMGNIGSEVFRALSFLERKDLVSLENSRLRVFELLEMTLQDSRWIREHKLRELARLHEVLLDSLFEQKIYENPLTTWQNYFIPFALVARKNR